MRTTITIDDTLFQTMQSQARAEGLSVSAYVRRAVRAFMLREAPARPTPFTLHTYGSGGAAPGVDLDRTSALLAADDASQYGPG